MSDLRLHAPEGVGEVVTGTDLAALVLDALELADGDVVVVTSKIVSKAEDRVITGDRDAAIAAETVRLVARRGPVRIVENRLGLTMAAAGVDASNLRAGTVAVLPEDPDATARAIRTALHERNGVNIAVVISDTAGRAWRLGQTDMAIGLAGIAPSESLAGTHDGYGNELSVTEPAIADEIAGAAELASGKLGRRPLVRVRGLADRVLPVGEHGPGARALVRPHESDMFALGTREAVVAAAVGDTAWFGPAAGVDEVLEALDRIGVTWSREGDQADRIVVETPAEALAERCAIVVRAHGWRAEAGTPYTRLSRD